MTSFLTTGAIADGLATITDDGIVLDSWFPSPSLSDDISETTTTELGSDAPEELAAAAHSDEDRHVRRVAIRTQIKDLSTPPTDAYDAYLRLHLLSHRIARPHTVNVEGILSLIHI